MGYTIKEAAQKTNLSIHTIRYYDKEGLLPFIDRENGARVFHDYDIAWLDLISCLKTTGMPIKDIRELAASCNDYETFVRRGLDILHRHKEKVEQHMRDTQRSLETIDYKIKHLPQMYKDKFAGLERA
ncbi:MerR family transcriptional regulator [Paenibacillus thailandensis]|uniref:MerR family transcriptional regulator n=1 Tax=Paenibacillus thailandensis TaxID=393250 RepID=A0ABW5R1N3_9BACL